MKLGDPTNSKRYQIHSFRTGFFSGNINPQKLEDTVNEYARKGWKLDRTICETTRQFLIFRRETHLLIFRKV